MPDEMIAPVGERTMEAALSDRPSGFDGCCLRGGVHVVRWIRPTLGEGFVDSSTYVDEESHSQHDEGRNQQESTAADRGRFKESS